MVELPQKLAGLITSITSDPFVFLLIVNLVLGLLTPLVGIGLYIASSVSVPCQRTVRIEL